MKKKLDLEDTEEESEFDIFDLEESSDDLEEFQKKAGGLKKAGKAIKNIAGKVIKKKAGGLKKAVKAIKNKAGGLKKGGAKVVLVDDDMFLF